MNEQAPNAVTMLILAILGYVVCAPCAWVAFFMAKGQMQQYPNCGMTKAAYWLGLVNIILAAVGIVIYCVFFVIMGASGAFSSAMP